MPESKKTIAIIGAGISGLLVTAYVAQAGHEVNVFEKHPQPGGRARQFTTENGYVFVMGPSWYWMADIINNFFLDFGYKARDFYQLVSLNISSIGIFNSIMGFFWIPAQESIAPFGENIGSTKIFFSAILNQ